MEQILSHQIRDKRSELKQLREREESLVTSIKKYVYNPKDSWKNHLKDECHGALYYLFGKTVYSYYPTYFGLSGHYQGIEGIYTSYIDKYEEYGSTSPIYCGKLKDLPSVIDYKALWKYCVHKDITKLSLEDFIAYFNNGNYHIEMIELAKMYYKDRLYIINHKDLNIKNIFILLPK